MLLNFLTHSHSQGQRPSKKHTLKAQGDGIAVLDWSLDDSLLLCCGRDDNPEAIVFSTVVRVYGIASLG